MYLTKYLPLGQKKGKLRVPFEILQSKPFTLSFLSGVFDTDGSYYLRKGRPVIVLSSATKEFIKQISNLLYDLNITHYLGLDLKQSDHRIKERFTITNRIEISSKKSISNFIKKIGFLTLNN
jgi:intein/homing endonuclease